VFVGLSVAGIVTGDMLKAWRSSRWSSPLANPTPEIMPDEAKKARPDDDRRDGRSDFSQSGQQRARLPLHLRGALDVRAKQITRR